MENNYHLLFPSSSSSSAAAAAFHLQASGSINAGQLYGCSPTDGLSSGLKCGGGAATETAGSADGKKMKKVRKPRYAFQTRSQVDILDDGYRWRKYGQKTVKNSKFPRSYYRCTFQGCSVKKQVQRLSGDESTVVTTYEGVHTHPIHKPTDSFEDILSQMPVFSGF